MSRSINKAKKKLKRRKRDHERTLQREAEVGVARNLLRRLGIWQDLQVIDLNLNTFFGKWPKLVVCKGSEVPPSTLMDKIVQEMRTALANTTFTFPGDYKFPIQTVWTQIFPVLSRLYHSVLCDARVTQLYRRIRKAIAPLMCEEVKDHFVFTTGFALNDILRNYSRIDDTMYYLEWEQPKDTEQHLLRFTVHQEKARPRRVVVGGQPRTGYWCGGSDILDTLSWIEWTGAMLGTEPKDRKYPVLVQRHVLERLYGRDGRLGVVRNGEPILHEFLWTSLNTPVFHPHPTDQKLFLVEYRIFDNKLGYLLGQIVEDSVLIHTFLFLTMDGTPEGTELWRQLRLSRGDKAYLGLDDIVTFAATDLRSDPDMVALLDKCKCKHLFDVLKTDEPLRPGYAQTMKEYLHWRRKPVTTS